MMTMLSRVLYFTTEKRQPPPDMTSSHHQQQQRHSVVLRQETLQVRALPLYPTSHIMEL